MTASDYFITALCIWKEARSQGAPGMVGVACVIRNRYLKNDSTPYIEVIRPLQFSSMTTPGDRQLGLYPQPSDVLWTQTQQIAQDVLNGVTADTTGGATLYYNPNAISTNAAFTIAAGVTVPFPRGWNPARVKYTVTIGTAPNSHIYFVET
jgi:spore germination cell wall hydrolase CwlJ-like protein